MKNPTILFLLLCGAIGLEAQAPTSSIPPSPGLASFDPTPVVAAFGQSSSWNAWADKAITTLGQQTQANTAAIAAIPAGLTGPPGPAGIQGATGPQGPAGTSPDLTSILADIAALKQQMASLQPPAPVPPVSTVPTITQQPQSQTVKVGQPVTFTVLIANGPCRSQWHVNGVDSYGAFASTITYTIPATTPTMNGWQAYVSLWACGPGSLSLGNSQSATLTVQ